MCQSTLALYVSTQQSDSRAMCGIERTLRRGAGTPHIRYNKGKVDGYKREIQEILGALNPPSSYPDEEPNMGELALRLAFVGPDPGVGIAAVSESGTPFTMLCRLCTGF